MSSMFGGGGGGATVDPSTSGYTADYGTWDGGSTGEAIPIQGSSGNIDAGTFDGSGQGGINWNKVLKAAQQLGGDGSGGKDIANLPGIKDALQKAVLGTPAHAGGLTALMQMLNQRRDMYMQAAMNPQAGPVQQQPPAPGLLGV